MVEAAPMIEEQVAMGGGPPEDVGAEPAPMPIEQLRREAAMRAAAAAKAAKWAYTPAVDEETDGWALTYMDVVTLLLTLFVALMARATLDVKHDKPEQAKPVVEQTVAAPAAIAAAAAPLGLDAEQPPPTAAVEQLQSVGFGEGVEVLPVRGGIQILIPDGLLFAPGRADLKKGAQEVMDKLASTLITRHNPITVEGHTDDTPTRGGRFPTNWELSTGRATAVVRALADRGIAPKRLRATGYGDTDPIASNATPEGRATNRRVVLLLSSGARGHR